MWPLCQAPTSPSFPVARRGWDSDPSWEGGVGCWGACSQGRLHSDCLPNTLCHTRPPSDHNWGLPLSSSSLFQEENPAGGCQAQKAGRPSPLWRWQGGGEGPHRLMPPGSWEVVDRRFNLSSVSSSVTQGIRLQAFSGTVCGKSVETCYYTQKKNATRRSQYSRDCRHHSAHAIPGTPGLGRWPGGPGRSSPFSVGCSLWRT